MSFTNNTQEGKFAFIKGNEFYLRNDNGKTELKGKKYDTFKNFTGYLEGIERKINGDIVNIHLKFKSEDLEPVTISFSQKSGYWRSFSRTFKNIELDQAITIYPYVDEQGRTVLFVIQNGETLKRFYTKETPHDLPQPTTVMFEGKEMLDFAEQDDFLFTRIESTLQGAKLPF